MDDAACSLSSGIPENVSGFLRSITVGRFVQRMVARPEIDLEFGEVVMKDNQYMPLLPNHATSD